MLGFNNKVKLLQTCFSGSQCASQSGMSMGGTRHAADIRADQYDQSSASIVGLQMGSNKGASQSGMSMGATRHAGDMHVDAASAEGQATLGLQMGRSYFMEMRLIMWHLF